MRWFESDRAYLERYDREQREINQRLHDTFRAQSLQRTNDDLQKRWNHMGLDRQKTEEWFRNNP